MVLKELRVGTAELCLPADGGSGLCRRLLDMGFADGMPVERLYTNPGGTLAAFRIQDSMVALRQADLDQIQIRSPEESKRP